MAWNHRVLAHEHESKFYLKTHEVYYDESKTPNGYTENADTSEGENMKDITDLNKMNECLRKPVLWSDSQFRKSIQLLTSVVLVSEILISI